MRRFLSVLLSVLALSIGVAAAPAGAGSDTGTLPKTTAYPGKPDIGGHSSFDLASVGYTFDEYLLEGTATAYGSSTPLGTDGKWTVTPAGTAPYRSRMIVQRPMKKKDFNGTVVVEWLNVSGNRDTGADWQQMHDELIRGGYAWVGVSAQYAGVNRMLTDPAISPRYGPNAANLQHPGDSFSYDIYSQAARVIKENPELVLGGYTPKVIIANGESQSASRMVTYYNAIQPLDEIFDGFFIHSRGASGAPLQQPPPAGVTGVPATTSATMPATAFLRNDLKAPAIVFQAENDTGGIAARQDDSNGPRGKFRLWEVAGTAHYDDYGLRIGTNDNGKQVSTDEWFASMQNPTNDPVKAAYGISGFSCDKPVNTGPSTFVARAGISHLNRWLTDGVAPPKADRLEVTSTTPSVTYALDDHGNALGGIRTPAVDAPVAKVSGFGNSASGGQSDFCRLFGLTQPLTQDQLVSAYKNQAGFTKQWVKATNAAVKKGFVLPADAAQIRKAGATSNLLGSSS